MNLSAHITPVILAGGLGTRLRSVVADRPKVLAEVAGRPFLAWLLNEMAHDGFRNVVLCTGYKAELIEAEFGSSYKNITLRYSHEATPLGTAGALRLATPLIETEHALAINGDSYCGADTQHCWAAHAQAGASASMLLTHVGNAARYGRVETNIEGWITSLAEKTGAEEPGLINAGKYFVRTDWLREIPSDRPISLEREIFPHWVARGFLGVKTDAPFVDIGTPASLVEGHHLFQKLGEDTESTVARYGT